MPLTGSKIIPAGWSEHHRPTAEAAMTGTCDIIGPAVRTGLDDAQPVVIATGVPCRVQQHNTVNGSSVAIGQEVTEREYLVAIPADTAYHVKAGADGHQVIVTSGHDPHVVGRRLSVIQVLYGNEVWQRDLLCKDNQTQNRGG